MARFRPRTRQEADDIFWRYLYHGASLKGETIADKNERLAALDRERRRQRELWMLLRMERTQL